MCPTGCGYLSCNMVLKREKCSPFCYILLSPKAAKTHAHTHTPTHTLLLSLTKSPPKMNHGMSNETHYNQSTCLTTQREHREGGLLVTQMHTNWHTFKIHIIMTISPHTTHPHADKQYHLHIHYVPFNTQLFTFISLSWSLFYFLLLSLPAQTHCLCIWWQ